VPDRIAKRPVNKLDLAGVHCTSMLKFRKRMPW
jgi:hypothetical protein